MQNAVAKTSLEITKSEKKSNLKRKQVILQEEVYIEKVSNLIKRDFYPLLTTNEDASLSNYSLDSFLYNHTSQDNASFANTMQKSNIKQAICQADLHSLILFPTTMDDPTSKPNQNTILHQNTRIDFKVPEPVIKEKEVLRFVNASPTPLKNIDDVGITWGYINDKRLIPEYKLPTKSKRERVADDLSDKASKSIGQKGNQTRQNTLLERLKTPKSGSGFEMLRKNSSISRTRKATPTTNNQAS